MFFFTGDYNKNRFQTGDVARLNRDKMSAAAKAELEEVCHYQTFFTARRSYASAVLGVVILSVCLSVYHTRAFVTNPKTYRRHFIPHERAIILVFSRQRSRRNSNGVIRDWGSN